MEILLLTCDPQSNYMSPNNDGIIGDNKISLIAEEGKEYDWVFVYEKVDSPIKLKVKEGQCIFIPGEPETIKGFGSSFVRQFDSMLSFRSDLEQITNFRSPCLTPWRVGLDEQLEKLNAPRAIRSYQEVLNTKLYKDRFMSMIVSNKTGTPLQRARIKLAQEINNTLPGMVHIYGRGFNDIQDKSMALDPYLFSVAVENSYLPYYYTEKLTDCFVTATVPLYSGCPNLDMFFGSGYIKIDVWDIEGTLQIIKDLYDKPQEHFNSHIEQTLAMRDKLLNKLNIIAYISNFANNHNEVNSSIVEKTLIPDVVTYWA